MKSRGELLLEIGCEEIPAGQIPKACAELQQILEKYLTAHGLASAESVETFGAPRRLVATAKGILLRQPDTVKEILGPPKSVAFDTVGGPTKAAESFAAKQGMALEKLNVVKTARGEYLAARQLIPGRKAKEILGEILPQAIGELAFPRSMYWTEQSGARFARPIRWIVALFAGEVVPFRFAGVHSGNRTEGHRFLGKTRIVVKNFRDYISKLRQNFVLADPRERQKKIEKELRRATAGKHWRIHADEDLLKLVTYLNEYPTVIPGDFSPDYLALPAEILITVMRDHQKYFAVERGDGELEPHFLAVVNLARDADGLVRDGHERVLRARLADAQFFWETDQRCRLADYFPRLAHVTFESRLGSYRDKTERLGTLARWVASQWFDSGVHGADVGAAVRATDLAKCDLATEMVREFTELQGIVGGLYARAQGEPEEVVWAIYDQYKPVGAEDAAPRNLAGCAVSLADKLDSLVGCFAVGMLPSGSSDPFALRRAASGIVQILLEKRLPLSLSAAVSAAAKGLSAHRLKIDVSPQIESQVLEFLFDRARYLLREKQGFAYDEVNAAMAAGADDLVDMRNRVMALKAIRRTADFEPLAIAFKRIRKILEKAGADGGRSGGVQTELFQEEAERKLHRAAQEVAQKATAHKRAGRYREALEEIAKLRPTVDRFFDDVLVMAEDEAVRRNRLALLARLLGEFSTIADFSVMVVEEGK